MRDQRAEGTDGATLERVKIIGYLEGYLLRGQVRLSAAIMHQCMYRYRYGNAWQPSGRTDDLSIRESTGAVARNMACNGCMAGKTVYNLSLLSPTDTNSGGLFFNNLASLIKDPRSLTKEYSSKVAPTMLDAIASIELLVELLQSPHTGPLLHTSGPSAVRILAD